MTWMALPSLANFASLMVLPPFASLASTLPVQPGTDIPPPATRRELSSWAGLKTGSIKKIASREQDRRMSWSFETSYRIGRLYRYGRSQNPGRSAGVDGAGLFRRFGLGFACERGDSGGAKAGGRAEARGFSADVIRSVGQGDSEAAARWHRIRGAARARAR